LYRIGIKGEKRTTGLLSYAIEFLRNERHAATTARSVVVKFSNKELELMSLRE
jgi:hypothetical protein